HLSPQDMGRVFQNLAANALYAVCTRRRQLGDGFSPAIRIATRDAGEHVEIRVRDNGGGIPASIHDKTTRPFFSTTPPGRGGIPASIHDKLMRPFFTTKPPGEGAGLGLSLSLDIVVQGNGGRLAFETDERDTTEFVVALPKRAGEI